MYNIYSFQWVHKQLKERIVIILLDVVKYE